MFLRTFPDISALWNLFAAKNRKMDAIIIEDIWWATPEYNEWIKLEWKHSTADIMSLSELLLLFFCVLWLCLQLLS